MKQPVEVDLELMCPKDEGARLKPSLEERCESELLSIVQQLFRRNLGVTKIVKNLKDDQRVHAIVQFGYRLGYSGKRRSRNIVVTAGHLANNASEAEITRRHNERVEGRIKLLKRHEEPETITKIENGFFYVRTVINY